MGDSGAFIIYNVYHQGDSVSAWAREDSLIVPEQVFGVDYIRGSGWYSTGIFTLEFVVRSTTGSETNCVAVFGP